MEYKCSYPGCEKTTEVQGERCTHGRAKVEMKENRVVTGSRYDVKLVRNLKSNYQE